MPGRISGLFGDRWVIGSYLVRSLPILVGIFLINYYDFDNKIKNLIYLTLFISLIVIVFSGERKALLLLLLYLFLIFLYLLKKIKTRNLSIIFSFNYYFIFNTLCFQRLQRKN